MEKYHKVEKTNVLTVEKNKSYWVKLNQDGSLDICSTNIDHPDYRAKVLAKKVEQRKVSKATREEKKKQRAIQKAKDTLLLNGIKV